MHAHDIKRPGTDTRQRILAVAVELFSTQGYAGTSIRDIAERMAMRKASLYYHFDSKEQILEAVTEPLMNEVEDLARRAAASPAPPPAEMLAALVDVLSRHVLLIKTVFNDPSAFNRGQRDRLRNCLRMFESVLAGSSLPADLLRARCAIGAVQAGVMGTVAGDPRFAEPLREDRAVRLLEGTEHALDLDFRREVVAAALRTLQ
jgi:TetR/AcrR family transcriptional regulator, regulator of cefoperazone and chloramphenicol sensitivity